MTSQKQLIALIAITASLTSFLAGYLFTQTRGQQAAAIQQQRGALIDRFSGLTDSATPTPLPPGLLQTSSDSVLAPVADANSDSVMYYHADNGYVSNVNLETRKNSLISTTQLQNLANVIWSADRNRVITVSRAGGGLLYKYFDYTSHAFGSYGSNVKDAVFSPDNQRVALVRSSDNGSTIEVNDFNGKNPTTILKTHLIGIKLFWQDPQNLSFLASDNESATQTLYSLNLNGDLGQLISGVDTPSIRWSPDGSKFIYSDKESGGIATYIFSNASQQSWPLSVQTEANTCDWTADQASIICAAQIEGQTSVLKIKVADGTSMTLFSHLIITTKNAFLSHSGNFLLMTSVGDQSVWELKLGN